jgi:putative transposase
MTNHYHLLVTTPNPDLAIGMHTLNHLYARSFNRRYKLTGHLFERRYHSVLVETDSHFIELVRYQALNPVRAGLCERADDWPWSSYRATLGVCECPDFLSVDEVLAAFAKERATAQRLLHEFVHDPAALRRAA